METPIQNEIEGVRVDAFFTTRDLSIALSAQLDALELQINAILWGWKL